MIDIEVIITVPNNSITKRAKEDVEKMDEELVKEGFTSLSNSEKKEKRITFRESMMKGLKDAKKRYKR